MSEREGMTNRRRAADDVPYRELAEWARKVVRGDFDRMEAAEQERRELRRERKKAS